MTAKRGNGANGAPQAESPIASLFVLPSADSFRASQRLALEAARFWARRMHAYADQMETLAACREPQQLISAQARFFAKMQDDYSTEREMMQQILAKPDEADGERA